MFSQLETPAVLVDLDVVDRNIAAMAALARSAGVRLRPHAKTHKSPFFGRLQVQAGAVGLTVAKLGEAEVFAAAGIDDLLIAYPLWGEEKWARLQCLLEQGVRVSVSLDSVGVARGIAGVGLRLGRPVRVYLEVDTGLGRCGTRPGEPTLALARQVAGISGITLAGLMTHAGHVHDAKSPAEVANVARTEGELLVATAALLRGDGLAVNEISVGSTPTAPYVMRVPGVTEVRPGAYIFNDVFELDTWAADEAACAAMVLTTVVSRPAPDRAVVDAGSKCLSTDAMSSYNLQGQASPGFGRVVGRPDLVLERVNEEHGIIRLTNPTLSLPIGTRLRVIPNHVCTMMNLHEQVFGIRAGRIEREIPIAARGKVT